MSTIKNTIATSLTLTFAALLGAAGCSLAEGSSEAVNAGAQNVETEERGLLAIAGSARIELGMVQLHDEVIVSEVAIASKDDIKPGFELELFAPTTLRPVTGVHGAAGLSLAAREMAIVSFAPVSAVARRPGGRQDAALYLDSSIPAESLYVLPSEYREKVAYTGAPGIAVTEAVCDFSSLPAEDATPYPGLITVGSLADGELHGAIGTMASGGTVKIRLVAQVEHCDGAITSAAQAKAEPRLCYEKLVWLRANGGLGTELGRLSGYRAPILSAQSAYCGD